MQRSGIQRPTSDHGIFGFHRYDERNDFSRTRSSSEIRTAAYAQGTTTLRQAAVQKVIDGETTLREINRVTPIEEVAN